mgnify:CR=1 FL=1
MPKLTNKCAICGKPILKSATLCATCIAKKEARQREIEQQQEIYNIRLQSDLLWEKRRYEIAKDCYARMIDETLLEQSLKRLAETAVEQADILIEALKGGSEHGED